MKRLSIALLPAMFATPALAHTGSEAGSALTAGLLHPLTGADHVLAMIAVGLWAAGLGGRAVLAVPAAFVAAMLGGFMLALAGTWLPGVEPMILASVVVLGVAVAAALRPSPIAAAALVGGFALFHGHAHGAEMAGAGALAFGAGFAIATAALHAAGIGLGLSLLRGVPARLVGAGTALAGAALTIG
jgi:urease accessory protein